MMKQLNNLHCVANKSEIFQLKKDSVEMFSAYILEVNLKNFIIFNLFYLRFCLGPHVFAGNSSLKACGCALAWYCQTYLTTHTHTPYFLNTSLTNNFSLHTTPLHT
jgi:hypothetical protein